MQRLKQKLKVSGIRVANIEMVIGNQVIGDRWVLNVCTLFGEGGRPIRTYSIKASDHLLLTNTT